MAAQGGGAIVNTASIAGLIGLPTSSAYVAAKHGVVGLTKTAAIEYAQAGIRTNSVCPGYIETDMTRDAMARRGEQILGNTPMRRMGTAQEIAEMVRSEEQTSELQSLMRTSYAVFCLKKKKKQ